MWHGFSSPAEAFDKGRCILNIAGLVGVEHHRSWWLYFTGKQFDDCLSDSDVFLGGGLVDEGIEFHAGVFFNLQFQPR